MRRRALITILVFCLAAASTFSQDKKRDWQTGKLISIEEGKPTTDYLATGPGSGERTIAHTYRTWIYTVESDTVVYQFSALVDTWKAMDRYPLTVGGQVKFALDPSKPDRAYLLDDRGKEFRASVKKAARQPAK